MVLAHKPTSMRTTQSLVRTSFLLAAAAFTFVEAPAASITVTTGATPIGTGGTVTTAADFISVNGGILEVTSDSTIGGLSGTGGQVSSGFQNPAYTHSILTLNVAAGESYVYNGTIRPNNWDGASVNALQITKTGLGTQELAGVLTGYVTSPGWANRTKLFASGGTLKLSGAWGFDAYVDYENVGGCVTANNGGFWRFRSIGIMVAVMHLICSRITPGTSWLIMALCVFQPLTRTLREALPSVAAVPPFRWPRVSHLIIVALFLAARVVA